MSNRQYRTPMRALFHGSATLLQQRCFEAFGDMYGMTIRSLRKTLCGLLVGVFFLGVVVSVSQGQLSAPKPPEVGYVYPPVLKIGTSTDVTLGGYDWTDDLQWFVHDPRIKLQTSGSISDYYLPPPPYWEGARAGIAAPPIPREIAARMEVPADATPGPVYWQVANANGSSTTALFYLSNHDEVIERRSRDLPQDLTTLPVNVSGRLSRLTEVDRYSFTPVKSGLINVELMARRLGANFQGVLEVRDAREQLLVDFSDTLGVDGAVTFAVQAGETYTVALRDVDFRGDRAYVYRLIITEGPRSITTIPASGQAGTTTSVEFVGVGLATGAPREESLIQSVTFPPAGTATAHHHRIETPWGAATFKIPLSSMPEFKMADLPPAENGTVPLTAPAAVTGRFASGPHEARYAWDSEEQAWWSIGARSQAIGSSLDVSVQILDPQGKPLIDNDDRGGTSDAGVEFQAPSAGRYTAVVRTVSSRSGALSEIYRLEVNRLAPDFRLTAPLQVDLPLGGKVDVKLAVQRLAGFNGPITVAVDGLPRGAKSVGDWTIAEGKNELTATIEAAADADVVAGVVHFQGTGTLNSGEVVRPATTTFGGNLAPRTAEELQRTDCMLSVTMPAPFEIKVVDRESQHEVHRGSTFLAELDIVRQPMFTGDLQIAMSAKQDRTRKGIRGTLYPVPAGATHVQYPTWMPEWLATDLTCRIVVHGVGAVPDPQGRIRYLTKSGDARITMIMEGALMKLESATPELLAQPGEELKVPVTVSRSVKLPLPTTVELVIPEELTGIVECDSLVLPVDTHEGTLVIRTKPDPRLSGRWNWTLKATAMQDNRWPVVAQAELDVRVEAAAKVAMP